MPFQKNNKRDYKREDAWDAAHPGRLKAREARHRARYGAIKAGMIEPGSKLQIDHILPLSKGGKTIKSNLRAVPASENESFKRGPKGQLVSQISTKERKQNAEGRNPYLRQRAGRTKR